MIGYDLHRPGQNYKSLFDAIKSYGTHWHILDSTWIISTSESASQIRDKLLPHIDDNDQLVVVGLSGEAAWYGFNQDGSQWLKQQLAA